MPEYRTVIRRKRVVYFGSLILEKNWRTFEQESLEELKTLSAEFPISWIGRFQLGYNWLPQGLKHLCGVH